MSKVVIAVGAAAVLVVVLFLAFSNGSADPVETPSVLTAKATDTNRSEGITQVTGHREYQEPRVVAKAVLGSRKISISSRDRRPGESDMHHQLRMTWLDSFERYEELAQLSPEQRDQLLRTMADIQTEAVLTLEDFERSFSQPGEVPSIREMSRSLRFDLAARAREFLRKEQAVELQRMAALPDGLSYGRYKPLDIEAE